MKACNEVVLGWVKDLMRGVAIVIIGATIFFIGVVSHQHGQAILNTLPSFQEVEPPPTKAGAPATLVTVEPFKGVL